LPDKDCKEMENAVMEISKPIHRSVMADEVVNYLITRPEGIYVDATLGMGGHTKSILERTNSKSLVIGLDVDEEAISISREMLSKYNGHVIYRNSNFSDIDKVLDSLDIREVDGIVADLGMSSYQIESSERGFSFMREEPLDMRMDPRLRFTAYDLVNEMTMDEISRVLKMYGEEKWSRRIAKRIVETRKDSPINTSAELARVVSLAIPKKFHPAKIHPATKTFQALRIAVNNELENIREFIEKAVYRLRVGGRLVVISFHSLEDRLVKTYFQRLSSPCICPPGMPECGCGKKRVLNILTRSPIIPGDEEISSNLRARSAKLRVGERV
jgi:16S rRNA (cytosine1402-N4)-methyltransferase